MVATVPIQYLTTLANVLMDGMEPTVITVSMLASHYSESVDLVIIV